MPVKAAAKEYFIQSGCPRHMYRGGEGGRLVTPRDLVPIVLKKDLHLYAESERRKKIRKKDISAFDQFRSWTAVTTDAGPQILVQMLDMFDEATNKPNPKSVDSSKKLVVEHPMDSHRIRFVIDEKTGLINRVNLKVLYKDAQGFKRFHMFDPNSSGNGFRISLGRFFKSYYITQESIAAGLRIPSTLHGIDSNTFQISHPGRYFVVAAGVEFNTARRDKLSTTWRYTFVGHESERIFSAEEEYDIFPELVNGTGFVRFDVEQEDFQIQVAPDQLEIISPFYFSLPASVEVHNQVEFDLSTKSPEELARLISMNARSVLEQMALS